MTRTADKAFRTARRLKLDLRAGRPISAQRLARLTKLDPRAGAIATRLMALLVQP